jgi:hypothetical protein
MNIRDLPHKLMRRLALDGEEAFDEWWKTTNGGKRFGTGEPLLSSDIFRHAFSKGVSAVLRRINEIKEVDTSNTRKGL